MQAIGESTLKITLRQPASDFPSLLTPPPNADLQRLGKGGDLQGQSGIKTTGCVRYLTLQTDSGPTANPLVRKAINLAVDKRALVLELGGAFAGEPPEVPTMLQRSLANARTGLNPTRNKSYNVSTATPQLQSTKNGHNASS